MLAGMVSRSRPVLLGAAALVVIATLAGCIAPDEQTIDTPSAAPVNVTSLPPECAKANMPVKKPGKLIIGVGDHTTAPWFIGDKPENGQGFEGALAAAIAEKLGYAPTDLTWVRVPSDKATGPGLKTFDIGIGEFAMTDAARQAVDFSAPYYNVHEVVVALKSSKIANVTNFGGLKEAKLGALANSASYDMINTVVAPSTSPTAFQTSAEAKKALLDATIDGLVVDLPTAFQLTAATPNTKIVGQLPLAVAQPTQFALVLEKNSLLTGCFSRTIEALRATKTLDQIEQQWLTPSAPNLA